MDNTFHSFDQNAPRTDMNGNDRGDESFTAAFETFTAEGTTNAFPGNSYSFNEGNLPQPTLNLWQPFGTYQDMANFNQGALPEPAPNTYEEMVDSQYNFNQFALPQPPITNAFAFNDIATPWAFNQQDFGQTLTELSQPDWTTTNALSGNTTGGFQPALATGSDVDAPFEIDEPDKNLTPSRSSRKPSLSALTLPMDGTLKCSWPGCPKAKAFKNEKQLLTHIENIHTYPLLCTQTGCLYDCPFAKKGDLDRHLASKHGIGRQFKCPQRECERHNRPFGRKDKLTEHMKVWNHGPYRCRYDHCRYKVMCGFQKKEHQSQHEEGSSHGEYECAIGECEKSKSAFTWDGMKSHLWICHGFRTHDNNFRDQLKPDLRVVTLEVVSNLENKFYLKDNKTVKMTCGYCAKGKTEEKST